MRDKTEAAIRAVSIAQSIADSREGANDVKSKRGIDLVTATDVACEDAIRRELLRAFPDYTVIGEERGGCPVDGRPYWLVDPICGTRPFASNIPLYCANIALVEDGEVTVGAVGIGKTGEILHAERGQGARLRLGNTDEPIAVSNSSNTIWIDGNTEQAASVIRRTILSKRWYVWRFSSSLAYAYVACGRIAAVIQLSHKSPDATYGSVHSAAGCFIAREAGAIITDLDSGKPWGLATASFLMSANAELHDGLLNIVQTERRPISSRPES
jgi:myo-inositol-1(or 4)-monophosphatase